MGNDSTRISLGNRILNKNLLILNKIAAVRLFIVSLLLVVQALFTGEAGTLNTSILNQIQDK